jgi:hypothetical protein
MVYHALNRSNFRPPGSSKEGRATKIFSAETVPDTVFPYSSTISGPAGCTISRTFASVFPR